MKRLFGLMAVLFLIVALFGCGNNDTHTTYNLTVNIRGQGTVHQDLKAAARAVYNEGDVVELTAVPDSGRRFGRWEGDVPEADIHSPIITITIDRGKTLVAVFLEPPVLPAPFATMSRVPGAPSFPCGTGDSAYCTTVNHSYYMAQTEVTFEQWSTVHDWAITNGYAFANSGSRGGFYITSPPSAGTFASDHETDPVTTVSWRDAIVWCNALTEYLNSTCGADLDCVYKSAGNPIRDATDAACDAIIPDMCAKGFRLPSSMEWELAARYKDGASWTPGSYASGATADFTNAAANNAVAWYSANSNFSAVNIYSTQTVGHKSDNALGLFDMSGNVWEWCFDHDGSGWILRGGSWYHPNTRLQLGYIHCQSVATVALNDAGFRVACTE